MNQQKKIILCAALVMMAATTGMLVRLRAAQHLGRPGIKATAIPGSMRMNIYLPDLVAEYKSRPGDLDPRLYTYMPKDSSFAQRIYEAPDRFQTLLNVVMMGTDRSTIHKPQFCLEGSGWTIDDTKSKQTIIPMRHPRTYDLPVMKLITSRMVPIGGQQVEKHGVYVYWFVADDQLTASHAGRMFSMARQLITSGVLQRWSYITCFSVCAPGEEDATYERMQKFIQYSVPLFQLVPGAEKADAAAIQTASK